MKDIVVQVNVGVSVPNYASIEVAPDVLDEKSMKRWTEVVVVYGTKEALDVALTVLEVVNNIRVADEEVTS